MNIFILDYVIVRNASYHCDKHVVKMILEYTQLLCNAHRLFDKHPSEQLYRLTHRNHPCTKWVSETSENYLYVYALRKHLIEEWRRRFQHTKEHGCERLNDLLSTLPDLIDDDHLTSFCQCMPTQYRIENNAVEAYRCYYINEKRNICQWRNQTPYWFV